MKKLIFTFVLTIFLVACGGNDAVEGSTVIVNNSGSQSEEAVTTSETGIESEESVVTEIGRSTDEAEQRHYAFKNDQVEIRPKTLWKDTAVKLSEPREKGEAPSCAFEGKDTVYYYENYEVQCGMIQGDEIITGVFLANENIATPEGLRIGMTVDEMTKIYGSDFTEEFGKYTYEDDEVELVIVADQDEIITISYIGKFNLD